MSQGVKIIQLGAKSESPFPIVDQSWQMFTQKGIKTIFLSIGSSASALPDLDLAESIGCPIFIVPLKDDHKAAWTEIADCLKTRKRDPAIAKFPFSEGAEGKWILPKNIRIQTALPWWSNGTADLSGGTMATEAFLAAVERMCKDAKVKNDEVRLDVLKIDTADVQPGLENPILYAALNAGLRPAILLVNWSRAPDQDLMATYAAGHLQNSGYRLVAKNATRFMYYFADSDMYQICSWENEKVSNPLVEEIVRNVKEQLVAKKPEAEQTKPATPAEEAVKEC